MGDRCWMSLDFAPKDKEIFLEKLKASDDGEPDETDTDGQVAYYEINYGGQSLIEQITQMEGCPPFKYYHGEGGDYGPYCGVWMPGWERVMDVPANKDGNVVVVYTSVGPDPHSSSMAEQYFEGMKQFELYLEMRG